MIFKSGIVQCTCFLEEELRASEKTFHNLLALRPELGGTRSKKFKMIIIRKRIVVSALFLILALSGVSTIFGLSIPVARANFQLFDKGYGVMKLLDGTVVEGPATISITRDLPYTNYVSIQVRGKVQTVTWIYKINDIQVNGDTEIISGTRIYPEGAIKVKIWAFHAFGVCLASGERLTFRPLYPGYTHGTVTARANTNVTTVGDIGYSREWNLGGWSITSLTMTIRLCGLAGWSYAARTLRMYVSVDDGTTFPYSIDKTIPAHTFLTSDPIWSSSNHYQDFTFDYTANAYLFGPKTRIKWKIVEQNMLVANAYWGRTQNPPPPCDYRDGSNNYVQYYTIFNVAYTDIAWITRP